MENKPILDFFQGLKPVMKQCIRVYPNGDYYLEPRSDEDAVKWVAYNKEYRFGNALFVDGECRAEGYFDTERCEVISEIIKRGALNEIGPTARSWRGI